MNIHEYQGKSLLKSYEVPVADGFVAENPEQAMLVAEELQKKRGTGSFIVKAQIHAGGRGKGGGVKPAGTVDEVRGVAEKILGMNLVTHQTGAEGKLVRKVLVEENVYYEGEKDILEFYVSLLVDRESARNVLMYSPEGGMDIEEVAEKKPEKIFKEYINPAMGIQPYQARKAAFNLRLEGKSFKEMVKFILRLYDAFASSDASLFEINPVMRTSDERILAVDCKVNLDDNALFRHRDLKEMRDLHEEDPAEVEAGKYQLNFVKLDGNVGCMVNGAGLAMATMDMIKLSGGEPANFLDVGGTASAETVEAGFRIILKDPEVKAILINIFGGIVRCDRVAQGVIDAVKALGSLPVPVVVRLQGTNAEEAKLLIDHSGLEVLSAVTLKEAAAKVHELV